MFPLSRPMTCAGLAAALVAFSIGVQAQPAAADASAQIRRTSFGVPHIVAKDERGLGYGVGYAYAQDNLCLLANEVLTVSGERSRFFGAKGKTLEQRDNLASDLFFHLAQQPGGGRCVPAGTASAGTGTAGGLCQRLQPGIGRAPWSRAARRMRRG